MAKLTKSQLVGIQNIWNKKEQTEADGMALIHSQLFGAGAMLVGEAREEIIFLALVNITKRQILEKQIRLSDQLVIENLTHKSSKLSVVH